ncbi:MAG: hypothetical protein AAF432_06945 [Planctomycetota bacterium]
MNDALLQTAGFWLAWLGFAVLVFALVLHHISLPWIKRRCCPKCWFDMSHTTGLTCSECGKTVKRERNLRKAKPRRRLAAVALLILLLGYAGQVTPGVGARGWVAAVPTPVLLCAVPFIEPDSHVVGGYLIGRATAPLSMSERCAGELAHRANENPNGQTWFQARCFDVARRLAGDDMSPGGEPFIYENDEAWLMAHINWRDVYGGWAWDDAARSHWEDEWPRQIELTMRDTVRTGDPVYARVPTIFNDVFTELEIRMSPQTRGFMPITIQSETGPFPSMPGERGSWNDDMVLLTKDTQGLEYATYSVELWVRDSDRFLNAVHRRWRMATWTQDVALPTVHDDLDVLQRAGDDDAVADAFAQVKVNAVEDKLGVRSLQFVHSGAPKRFAMRDTAVGCHMALYIGDERVGTTEVCCRADELLRMLIYLPLPFEYFGSGLYPNGHSDEAWTLRISCSRTRALRVLTATHYIEGSVVLPVDVSGLKK